MLTTSAVEVVGQPSTNCSILRRRREPRRSRPAHLARRDRPPAHDRRRPGTWFPLRALRRAAAAGRIGAIAPRFHGVPTNRSQRDDARGRRPGDRRRAAAPTASMRRSSSPTARSATRPWPRRPPARGERHRHRRHGLRQGHRRACRRAALLFSDFPLGNAAGRPMSRIAGRDARARARAARERRRRARTTVQSPLRWSDERRVEARLLQHRPPRQRRDRAPSRRIRRRQGASEGAARRVGVMRRPRRPLAHASSRCSRRSWTVTPALATRGDPLESSECRRALAVLNSQEAAVGETWARGAVVSADDRRLIAAS